MSDYLHTPSGHSDSRSPDDRSSERYSFLVRTLIVAAVAFVGVLILLLLLHAGSVLVLLFAGVLFAVILRGAANLCDRWTGVGPRLSLVVVLGLLAALAVVTIKGGQLVGVELVSQFKDLSKNVKDSWEFTLGRIDLPTEWRDALTLPPPDRILGDGVMGRITGGVSLVLGIIADIVVVLFIAIFIAADPRRYRSGLLHLVPLTRRGRAEEVLDALHTQLLRWMAGTLFDMVVVGFLTTLGLYLLGVPQAQALGLLTALLVFVPYIGPVLSAIPAILVGLTVSPETGLYVLLLYISIQTVESYLLQPLIQERSIHLAPAVILGSQLLLGVLLGTVGILFATPLAAATVVLIRMLYINDVLGDPVRSPSDPDSDDSEQETPADRSDARAVPV